MQSASYHGHPLSSFPNACSFMNKQLLHKRVVAVQALKCFQSPAGDIFGRWNSIQTPFHGCTRALCLRKEAEQHGQTGATSKGNNSAEMSHELLVSYTAAYLHVIQCN